MTRKAHKDAWPEALNRIAACNALDSNGKNLDLRGLGLATLPLEVNKLTALTTLFASGNELTKLPPEIGQLTALRWLDLSDNRLTALPPEIGRLTALENLNVSSNKLTTLPMEIGQLTALTRLALAGNPLTGLPPQIGGLAALETLNARSGLLTTLPREIGNLTALTRIFLENNRLTELPREMLLLTELHVLELRGNPALGLPESVLGAREVDVTMDEDGPMWSVSRPIDILNFYHSKRAAAAAGTLRPVNEIKVMLVGRGGAGKTSLRRYFMNEPHNKNEVETAGIALDNFQLFSASNEITVRLWDFAGQEITHALHQFFLTEGCVYILVLDPRSNTEARDAEYWLNLLNRYALGAPVLVALNRQDARQGGYDVDRNGLRERFPCIKDFVSTNCENRDGCDELRHALAATIEKLGKAEPPHLGVPEAWLKVMDECFAGHDGRQLRQESWWKRLFWLSASQKSPKVTRQHLTLDEFRELCASHGVAKSETQESLARLLHKLGAVLHFIDEPRLRDTTVLNPHWVTDGVYRLLRYRDRKDSDGILTLTNALAALPDEIEETARFLLRLMERFEMCFPLDEQPGERAASKWLVPGALTEFQPSGIGPDWQQANRVRLRYQYDPLPEGLLPRFIVLTHLLSEGRPRWRYGVVLQDGAARALVRKAKENTVEVTALGPEQDRLRLLEIVQGNLERVHADLPKPKPVAEMELAGLAGTFRLVADLEAAEVQKQSMAVKTDAGDALVEPTAQLNRTSDPESRDGSRVPLHVFVSYSHKDKVTKNIFHDNLTVLQQKKYITPWHDGLIEPGMRWRTEIEDNLEKMDVFIGLLTTAFLASDFIQTVELNSARKKLKNKGKEFRFVLILVDDISLQDLDLAEYQILKPGGKAVAQHSSRKAGFNVAQKELETLFHYQQKLKELRRSERR